MGTIGGTLGAAKVGEMAAPGCIATASSPPPERPLPALRAPILRPGEQQSGEQRRRGDCCRRVEARGVSQAGAASGGAPQAALFARISDPEYYQRWMRRDAALRTTDEMSVHIGRSGMLPCAA